MTWDVIRPPSRCGKWMCISQTVMCSHICLAGDEKWKPAGCRAVVGHTMLSAAIYPDCSPQTGIWLQVAPFIVPGGARQLIRSFKDYIYIWKERKSLQLGTVCILCPSGFNILVSLSNDDFSLLYMDRMNPRSLQRAREIHIFTEGGIFYACAFHTREPWKHLPIIPTRRADRQNWILTRNYSCRRLWYSKSSVGM